MSLTPKRMKALFMSNRNTLVRCIEQELEDEILVENRCSYPVKFNRTYEHASYMDELCLEKAYLDVVLCLIDRGFHADLDFKYRMYDKDGIHTKAQIIIYGVKKDKIETVKMEEQVKFLTGAIEEEAKEQDVE